MKKLEYSVIIRTLTGGEKYLRLLKSINSQTITPKHIYIILPHGYPPPSQSLGGEEIIYTNRGMWEQRIFGMEYVYTQSNHTPYLLVCDDDVEFDENFVKQLLDLAVKNSCDTLVPIKEHKTTRFQNILSYIIGGRTENSKSKYKITIKRNGRFSVNNTLKNQINPTQSGPFACFLMKTNIYPILNLREEMWLDDTRYALPDDQVFFYKAFLLGLRTYSCRNPTFIHLDGKNGTTDKQRFLDVLFSRSRNIVIFWRKFILSQKENRKERIITKFSFRYYLFINSFILLIIGCISWDLKKYRAFRRGINDGKKYFIKSPFQLE